MRPIQNMGWRELLDNLEETATPEQMPYVVQLRGLVELMSEMGVHSLDMAALAVRQRQHLDDLNARLQEWNVEK